MSKNLTLKGAAFGAVVALGTTLFAGAPAQAASVLFAPTTGTGNTLVAGETFSLTASLSSELPASNSTQLKFKVANTTGVAATVTLNSKTLFAPATAASHLAGASVVALDASVGGTTAASALGASTASAVYGLGSNVAADSSAIIATTSAATNPTSIQIASTAATTASYTVTAFLDANNNAVIDSGELSAVQTVNFVKVADSGLSVSLTKPIQYSTALAATVTFASDVNVAQITSTKYKVGFGLYGVSGATSALAGGAIADNLSTTAKNTAVTALTATATASAAPAAGATYNAQVFYENSVSTWAAVGTAVNQVVASAVDADATALTVGAAVSDNVKGSGSAFEVRSGTTSTSVSTTIKKTPTGGATALAVGAGVPVDVYVTAATAATPAGGVADTLTVAGVTIVPLGATPNVSSSVKIATLTTDANGKIVVPVTSSLGTVADSVTIALKVQNAASTATGSASLTWEAATLVAPKFIYAGDSTQTVVKGSAVTRKYALTDSFGALYVGDKYQLLFTAPGIAGSVAATPVNVYAPFVNGIATVSYTDNSLAAGTNAATYKVLKNVDGAWVQPASAAPDVVINTANGTTLSASYNVVATAQVASVVSASAANSDAAANTSTVTASLDVAGLYAAGDPRSNANGFVVPAPTAASIVTIAGTVTDASGVGVAGAQVTLSLAGAQFASAAFANANAVYAKDSITVNAGTNGAYTVYVATHTAGVNSLVVTSGAATKTLSVYVAAAAGSAAVKATVTPGSATYVAGQTVVYTIKLTDTLGNPVNTTAPAATPTAAYITVTYAGPGVISGSLPVETDAAGEATVRIATGTADSAAAVLTVKYDQNFDGDFVDTYDLTASSSVAVSNPSAAVATVTVTAATTSQAGRAIDVTVKAVDAAGAAVAGAVVVLSSVGAGSLASSSVVTNAAGVAVVKLVAGSADLGASVVTATSNAKSGSATIDFGATDSSVDIIGKRVYVTTEFAAGKRVTIYDNGVRRYSAIQTSDAEKVVMWNVKSGSHTIVVKISGASSDSVTFLVK